MISGVSASMTEERPAEPKLSLYSDQPIRPSSVVTLRKENSRQPASARSVSTWAIFIACSVRFPMRSEAWRPAIHKPARGR